MVPALSCSLSYILIMPAFLFSVFFFLFFHMAATHRNTKHTLTWSAQRWFAVSLSLAFFHHREGNSSSVVPPVIKSVVFISLRSLCIKQCPSGYQDSHLFIFLSPACRLPLSRPYWRLALLICIDMPPLCPLWAAKIQQFRVYYTSPIAKCHGYACRWVCAHSPTLNYPQFSAVTYMRAHVCNWKDKNMDISTWTVPPTGNEGSEHVYMSTWSAFSVEF